MNKKEYLEALGARIEAFRKEKGYTKEDFSKKISTSRMQLYRIEKGKINTSIGVLRDICIALEINMTELLDIEK